MHVIVAHLGNNHYNRVLLTAHSSLLYTAGGDVDIMSLLDSSIFLLEIMILL
jgi:hypothetical protein